MSVRRLHSQLSPILLVFLLATVLFWPYVNAQSIWSKNIEGMRAAVVREMFESGDWLLSTLNGEVYIAKPPLYFWLALSISKVLGGVSEFSCRLPSIISAYLYAVVVLLLGTHLFSRRVGAYAAIILICNPLFIQMARSANIDMLLAFLTTSAVACITYYATQEVLHRRWFLAGALLLALAVLTKGPIGVLVPGCALAGLVFDSRARARIREAPWSDAIALALMITLPWAVYVAFKVPNSGEILYQETLFRYERQALSLGKPWHTYLTGLIAGLYPWSFFLPAAGIAAWRCRSSSKFRPKLLLLASWILPCLIIFSVTSTKRAYYLLPLFPAFALLLAWAWNEWSENKFFAVEEKLARASMYLLGVILACSGVVLITCVWWFKDIIEYPALSCIFSFLVGASGLLLLRAQRVNNHDKIFYCLISSIVSFGLLFCVSIFSTVDAYRTRKVFFREAAQVAQQHKIFNYRFNGYDLQFYVARVVPSIERREELEQLWAASEKVYVIIEEKNLSDLNGLAHHIILERGWSDPLTKKLSKRMYLVSNLPVLSPQ